MDKIKDKLAQSIKAIVGLVVGVASSMLTTALTEGRPVPSVDPVDWNGWVLMVAIGLAGYLGVYLPRNKRTPDQVVGDIERLPTPEAKEVIRRWASTEGSTTAGVRPTGPKPGRPG